jgi:hypothetical protein
VSAPDILAAALWLQARHGMHVFAVDHPGLSECVGAHRPDQPCDGKRGKHPVGKWSRDATLDPGAIRAALSRGLRNVGIACGPSGLLLVDEDRPGAFCEYAASVGQAVPETFTVDTGRGRHFYFRAPDGPPLGNSPGALAGRAIDIRGRGGFVVAPGSIHVTGVIYSPVDSAALVVPTPEWLVTALRAPRPRPTATPRPRQKVTGGRPHRVLAGLVQTVLDATPDLDRNSRLFWAACRMYGHAAWGLFDEAAGRAALQDAARHVGLPDGETEKTLDSAARAAMGGAA